MKLQMISSSLGLSTRPFVKFILFAEDFSVLANGHLARVPAGGLVLLANSNATFSDIQQFLFLAQKLKLCHSIVRKIIMLLTSR